MSEQEQMMKMARILLRETSHEYLQEGQERPKDQEEDQ